MNYTFKRQPYSYILQLFIVIFFSAIAYTVSAQKLKPGDVAPSFTSISIHGTQFSLDSVKGKIALIDFWAPWCSPCLENNEELISIYQAYNPKGFEIVAIAIEKDREKILKTIKKFQYPWKILLWEIEEGNSPVSIKYEVKAIPSSFLIDETGKILLVNPDSYDLEKKLKELLRDKK